MTAQLVTREVSPEAYNALLEQHSKLYATLAKIVCTLDGEGPLEAVREEEFDTIVPRILSLKQRIRNSISVHSF